MKRGGLRRWTRHKHHGQQQARGGGTLLMITLAASFAGCLHRPTPSDSMRHVIYERANVQFDRTVLVKPADSARPEFRFAPLLVLEVDPARDSSPGPSEMYCWRTFAKWEGQDAEQFNYVWFRSSPGSNGEPAQGVRVTLDRSRKPVLWEILHDPSGARIVYVSQSVEARAMTDYPAPLPGRRFWIERSVDETPDVVVARILEDGPTPMGPILYLPSASNHVLTLICRCMEAQAKEVVGMATYQLVPLDDVAMRRLSQVGTPAMHRWLPQKPAEDPSRWLRLESDGWLVP